MAPTRNLICNKQCTSRYVDVNTEIGAMQWRMRNTLYSKNNRKVYLLVLFRMFLSRSGVNATT